MLFASIPSGKSRCPGLRGPTSWKATARKTGIWAKQWIRVSPPAGPAPSGRQVCARPARGARCYLRAHLPRRAAASFSSRVSRSCRRLAGLRTHPAAGAAAAAWEPRAPSGFSWLSSRRGSSVSWEWDHGGRDASGGRDGLCATMQRKQSKVRRWDDLACFSLALGHLSWSWRSSLAAPVLGPPASQAAWQNGTMLSVQWVLGRDVPALCRQDSACAQRNGSRRSASANAQTLIRNLLWVQLHAPLGAGVSAHTERPPA